MRAARFAAAVLFVTLVCAEAPLQQPPRDGRRLMSPPGQLATEANAHYRAGQWARAAEKYEAALAAQPNLSDAYFYLAHSYDQLYVPSSVRDTANVVYLEKAVRNYRLAAERDPDPKMRKLALEYLVAAYGPDKLDDAERAAAVIKQMIEAEPGNAKHFAALAKVYEDMGQYDEAVRALTTACEKAPGDAMLWRLLAGLFNRRGEFEKTIEALRSAAELEPRDPRGHQLIATYYWEKAYKDRRLSRSRRVEYIARGIEATDRALALDPLYADALTFKNLLLRMSAREQADPAVRAMLNAEADLLRDHAIELTRQRGDARVPAR